MSALHGRGTGDLLDDLVDRAAHPGRADDDRPTAARRGAETEAETKAPSVALVGRPNVGKSTLFNRLIGDERSVVHDLPGTTRDTDRHRGRDPEKARSASSTPPACAARPGSTEGTEYYSLVRALQAIDRADVALLVIDATVGVTHQDQRLAERIDAAGCPVVVLLNKWELLDAEARARGAWPGRRTGCAFLGDAPVLKISALSGLGVHKLLPALADTIDDYHRRIPTRQLNKVIARAQAAHAGARRPGALRHPGRHRPAHLHPVRHRRSRPPTCAT